METNKKILHLNLKRKWFDMILSGDKKEEYREIKPYWNRIFQNGKIKIKGRYYHPSDVIISFANGYKEDRPQFFIECKNLVVRGGKWYWGAEENEQYYVLVLGDILF